MLQKQVQSNKIARLAELEQVLQGKDLNIAI